MVILQIDYLMICLRIFYMVAPRRKRLIGTDGAMEIVTVKEGEDGALIETN